jgi:hypothetical protein
MAGPTKDWRAGELAACCQDYEVMGRNGPQRVRKGEVYRVLEVEKRRGETYLNVKPGDGYWLYVLFRKIQPATEGFTAMLRACKPAASPNHKVLETHDG